MAKRNEKAFEIHRESTQQGNWKREGVATRYELEVAIDRLLERGKVVVLGGLLMLASHARERGELRMRLSLASVKVPDIEQRQALWAAEDERIRRHCQQMECHATHNTKAVDFPADTTAGSLWEAALQGDPRPSVAKYVLRELKQTGPMGYEAIVTSINERGGWEWVLEAPRVVRKAKAPREAA